MKSATTTASNCAAGIRLGSAWEQPTPVLVELPVELVEELVDFVE